MTPAMMAPRFLPDEDEDEVEVEVLPGAVLVAVVVDPDCVTVIAGDLPVAMGPSVAAPAAGVVTVAPPEPEPPITLMTISGTW